MNLEGNAGKASLAVVVLCLCEAVAAGQEIPLLPPLTPAEISMADNPKQPGGEAAILYYAVDTDNQKRTERHALRIKVFRDEGKKYADIKIRYTERYTQVEEIQGRTIGSDGKVTPFAQEIFDREIVKYKKFGYREKIFTLPNVTSGAILEYSYRLRFKEKIPDLFQHPDKYVFVRGYTYPAAEWEIQHALYLVHGRFSLLPVKGAQVDNYAQGMDRVTLVSEGGGRLTLDVHDIAGFEEEEYALPEDELRKKVSVYYEAGVYSMDSFWFRYASTVAKEYDKFINGKNSKVIDGEVARLVARDDTAEAKLKKLYDRAQQIRYLNYEDPKTEKEIKRENLKENRNAEEVLEHGYASANEINLLFIAMARSAGMYAVPVQVTSRKTGLFKKEYPEPDQLNAMVVLVESGGVRYVLDPATRYCPFGLLPWEEAGAAGIVVDANTGKVASTASIKSSESVTRTTGQLKLDAAGTLAGTLQIQYEKEEALIMRLWGASLDDINRNEEIESLLQKRLPHGSIVKLKSVEGWEKTNEPLTTKFDVEIQNYAMATGRRLVVPLGVLHTTDQNPFPSNVRRNSIYFEHAFETHEDIRIALPPGMEAESLPKGKDLDLDAMKYKFSVSKDGDALQVKRSKVVQAALVAPTFYANVRGYFGQVLAGDTQQVTVKSVEGGEKKPAAK